MIPVAIRRTEPKFFLSNRTFDEFKNVLRIGQVIQGRVVRVLAEHKALVRLMGFTVVAESRVPLRRGERVTVAVRSIEPIVHLRLAPTSGTSVADVTDYRTTLRALGLEIDTLNLALIEQMIRYGLPVKKRMLKRLRKRITDHEFAPRTKADLMTMAQIAALLASLGLPINPETVNLVRAMMKSEDDSIDYTV